MFLVVADLSRPITYIWLGWMSRSFMCKATGEFLFRVLMSRLCSRILSVSLRPVSPMYCILHAGQVILYTTLIVEQVMCPVIRWVLLVDVEVIWSVCIICVMI